MFFIELLVALILGIILAGVLVRPLSRRGPGPLDGMVFFFILLFLFIWAGGAWTRPVGAPLYGVYWFPFFVFGAIGLMLVAALMPEDRRRRGGNGEIEIVDPREEKREEAAMTVGVTAVFGLLVTLLLVAIVARYLILA